MCQYCGGLVEGPVLAAVVAFGGMIMFTLRFMFNKCRHKKKDEVDNNG